MRKGNTMAMLADEIIALIKQNLDQAEVEIKDLAGDNDHFAVYVTSGVFRGKTRIQQHQLVYQALEGRVGGQLHALSIHTKVPNETK